MRVIADHIRAMTFLIADGVVPVQRMARLRAAQDHAARDASRPQARISPSRFSSRSSTSSSARWAARIPSSRPDRDADRAGRAQRRGALRHGADRRAAPPRGRARAGGARRPGRRPASRRSSCTTPTGCRATSSRTWPARRGCSSTPKDSSARWRVSARRRARRARSTAAHSGGLATRVQRPAAGAAATPTSFAATSTTVGRHADHRAAEGRRPGARSRSMSSPLATRVTSCSPRRRSISSRADRCRIVGRHRVEQRRRHG